MAILDFFRKKKTEDKFIPVIDLFNAHNICNNSPLKISAGWACINLIADTIATLPIEILTRDKQGIEIDNKDSVLYDLLKFSPNEHQTKEDFFACIVVSLELFGTAYIKKTIAGNKLISLIPLKFDDVSRVTENEQIYYYHKTEKLTSADIIEIKGRGGGIVKAWQPLFFGKGIFEHASASEEVARKFFINGLMSQYALEFTQDLTKEQYQEVKQYLAELAPLGENGGKPPVLPPYTKLTSLQANFSESQMLESRIFAVEEICRFFGIPPHMVGAPFKGSSLGGGIEATNAMFLQYCLRGRIKRIESAFEKSLFNLSERKQGYRIKFNFEGLLRADSKTRAENYQKMLASGVMTINEARALEGLSPVTGGDIPRMQMQYVPITQNPMEATDGNKGN
ncbi:phage portal protein [Bartonella sp. DGB1]|uniref:phage portal protein n=1 Tax=Bartonella sp. DGB1 TaxID=3239807 RepID=UPI003524E391